MARTATATRDRLLRAGERLFATEGVDTALTQDIVKSAGTANDSAIGYHFGSRQALLQAILDKHIALMEIRRHELSVPTSADLRDLVTALVVPTAERLETDDGRDFLRIIAQLSDRAGVRRGATPEPIRGTQVALQLGAIERALSDLPTALRRERISAAILLLTASLADRARRVTAGGRQPLSHRRYVDNLVDMITGLLTC